MRHLMVGTLDQTYSIANSNQPSAHDRRIHTSIVLIEPRDCFHDPRVLCGGVWIEVDHYTTNVGHRNVHCRTSRIAFTKHQRAAHPLVLEKWVVTFCFDQDVCSEAATIEIAFDSSLAADASDSRLADH